MATPLPPLAIPPHQVREELEKLLDSKPLRNSLQLRNLLRYVVEETLCGREDGLKEYNLGLTVFHRQRDYDPHTDAIVRVQASLLRKKLQTYYDTEGRDSRLRIDLPRGGYVPSIAVMEPPPDAAGETVEATQPQPVPEIRRRVPAWLAFLIGVVGTAAAAWLIVPRSARPTPPAAGTFWKPFVQPGVETVVSLGAPLFWVGGKGLYIRDVDMNESGANHSENLRAIEKGLGISLRPQDDVYTGIGEAFGMLSLTRWLDRHNVPVTVANSHYLGPSSIGSKNVIVVSSLRFQTILSSMQLPNLFPFDHVGSGAIINTKPLPGEPPDWRPAGGGLDTSPAIISVWPGPAKGRSILFMGGVNTWATEAAVKFVLDPKMIGDLEKRLAADPADGPRGRKGPYFQVVIMAEAKYNELRMLSYITHRYLPDQRTK